MHPLISVVDLGTALGSAAPPMLLDVRWSPTPPTPAERYAAGHLPGAVFVDLDRDLAAAPGSSGRHPLPDPGVLQTRLRVLGLRERAPVVVYDDAGGTTAARAWWLLRWAGHDAVQLLDGGIGAWRHAGREVSTEPVETTPGDIVVRPGRLATVDAAGALDLAAAGSLLDARAAERFRGEVEPIDPVAGHIPGARSAPTTDNLGADGRFRPPAELRSRFAALGVDPAAPVGVYCGSGVTAAHEVLALALAGVEAVLYPGSWSEWVADPSRPVATGPQDGPAH